MIFPGDLYRILSDKTKTTCVKSRPGNFGPARKERSNVPWYWILIILSAIVGPFEAMYALNKARKNREAAEKREAGPDEPDQKG